MMDKPKCKDCWFYLPASKVIDEPCGECFYKPPVVIESPRWFERPMTRDTDFCAYYWDGEDGGLDG
jgi:hypothetical protein